jgi:hypothetical protein
LLQQLADKTWGKFYRILGQQSFNDFFTQLSKDIIDHQQQKIQNIIRKLNDYLMYVLVFALLGLLGFMLFIRYKR